MALVAGLLLHLHIHHHFHGPPVDYLGLALACAASWIGVPGPGEPVLVAAALFAAKGKLDIVSVIGVAFLAAAGGGIAGWLIGLKAGRAVLARRGPLLRLRLGALARGDAIFDRRPVLAIVLTPSWVAGIHRVRVGVYLITNLVGAVVWSVGIGLAAYFAGPAVIDLLGDLGALTSVGLVLLIALTVGAEMIRRRRRRRHGGQPARAGAGEPPAAEPWVADPGRAEGRRVEGRSAEGRSAEARAADSRSAEPGAAEPRAG
jgi:membrane protein DedA with SNARE-associated domain